MTHERYYFCLFINEELYFVLDINEKRGQPSVNIEFDFIDVISDREDKHDDRIVNYSEANKEIASTIDLQQIMNVPDEFSIEVRMTRICCVPAQYKLMEVFCFRAAKVIIYCQFMTTEKIMSK